MKNATMHPTMVPANPAYDMRSHSPDTDTYHEFLDYNYKLHFSSKGFDSPLAFIVKPIKHMLNTPITPHQQQPPQMTTNLSLRSPPSHSATMIIPHGKTTLPIRATTHQGAITAAQSPVVSFGIEPSNAKP